MKRVIYLLAILVLVSCEKFDLIKDNAEIKSTAPNAYMSPINPTSMAGDEVIVPVQYWSSDDVFNYLGLWHSVDTSTLVYIELAPVSLAYTYEHITEGEKIEETEYKEYQFGYDDWVPSESAYVRDLKYVVDNSFEKISVAKGGPGITVSSFADALYPEAANEFYTNLVKNLSKSQMQILFVDTHMLIAQGELDAKYDANNDFTDSTFFKNKLQEIGLEGLVGNAYKYEKVHTISLRFKVINGSNTEGISVYRTFNIQ